MMFLKKKKKKCLRWKKVLKYNKIKQLVNIVRPQSDSELELSRGNTMRQSDRLSERSVKRAVKRLGENNNELPLRTY